MKPISHSRNSLLTLLSWLLPLGLTFFATPFIVRGLGNEQYGFYALMTGFIAYSFTFNIGRAVTKYVVEFNAAGEKEKVSEIISATFFLSLFVATIGSLFLVFISEILVDKVLLIDAASRENTILALRIAALCIWLMIIGQVFIAVVQATHRFEIYSLITTITNVLLISGNVFLVWKDFGFLYLVGWNAFAMLFSSLCFFIAAKKLEPETKITFGFGKEMFLKSLKFGLSVAGHQIFANVQLLYERMLITRIAGADKMTNYVVPMTMAIYILVFISNLTLNLMPYTSELFSKQRFDELEIIYRRLTKIVCAMVVFICVSLAVGSYSLLANWIGAAFAEESYIVFIFQLATFGLLACMIISWQFIEGFGLPVYNTASGLSWLIISIPLMLIFTNSHGIWGTALARLIAEITIPVSILLVEKKIFGKILSDLWLKIISLLGLAAIIAGIGEKLLLEYFSISWISLLFSMAVFGFIYLGILWFTKYFSEEEKFWIFNQVKKVFA